MLSVEMFGDNYSLSIKVTAYEETMVLVFNKLAR